MPKVLASEEIRINPLAIRLRRSQTEHAAQSALSNRVQSAGSTHEWKTRLLYAIKESDGHEAVVLAGKRIHSFIAQLLNGSNTRGRTATGVFEMKRDRLPRNFASSIQMLHGQGHAVLQVAPCPEEARRRQGTQPSDADCAFHLSSRDEQTRAAVRFPPITAGTS